jgi:2-amino-4-hydroxy-6-hydroxymethyldihydropteridine diphosphokinase
MTRFFLGIGSNIDREKNIQGGIAALSNKFGDLIISPVYESKPFGFEGDDFYNLVVGFDTQLDIENVNSLLRDIEFQFGRHQTESHFSSRTLDIDLLLFGNLVSDEHHVPRHDVTDYSFVLCPLAMIAPDLKHPVSGQRLCDLWQNFDKSIHEIRQVNFDLTSC